MAARKARPEEVPLGSGRFLGYARVSTVASADKQTFESQIPALMRAGVPEREIRCERVSGATPLRSRPVLSALLDELRPGDTLVIFKLDRLARNVLELLKLAEEFQIRRVSLRAVAEPFDTTTEIGVVLYQLLAVFANFEREALRERTRAGISASKGRGVSWGRRPGVKLRSRLTRAESMLAHKERTGKTYPEVAEWADLQWPRPGGARWHPATMERWARDARAARAGRIGPERVSYRGAHARPKVKSAS